MSIISNIRGAECVICALFYDCRGAYCIKPAASVCETVIPQPVTLLMNNINSIRRESPGNKSLYEAKADKSIFRLIDGPARLLPIYLSCEIKPQCKRDASRQRM